MEIIVQKYGGTSVGNIERVQNVATHILAEKKEHEGIVVVVSAPAGMTDDLLKKAKQCLEIPTRRELDMLLSTGEQISSALLALALQKLGQKAVAFNGMQLPINTTDEHFNAKITSINVEKIHQALQEGYVVIVTGFQGVNTDNEITTLGRGGSDTSAVALGVALLAKQVDIYTDVDGVYTADPRMIPQAFKLDTISSIEMLELASAGAKVLHPRSVELAAKNQLTIHLRSSFNNIVGTWVKEKKEMEQPIIKGIAHTTQECLVKIKAESSDIVRAIRAKKIPVELVLKTEKAYTLLVNDSFREELLELLKVSKITGSITEYCYDTSKAKMTLVGLGLKSKELIQEILLFIEEQNISCDLIATSDCSVSFLVSKTELSSIMQALHQQFIERGLN